MTTHMNKISTPGLLMAYLEQYESINYETAISYGFSDTDIVRLIDSGEITFTIDSHGATLALRNREAWVFPEADVYHPEVNWRRRYDFQ